MLIRRVLALCVMVTLVGAIWPVFAQRNNQRQQQQQQQQQQEQQLQQQDIETLVRLVDAVSAGQEQPPAAIPVRWESNHFIKGQGGETYIPFTVAIDPASLTKRQVALYVRVVDKQQAAATPPPSPEPNQPAQRMPYAWDNLHFIEVPADGKVSRAIALKPGEYEAFITIKERATEVRPQGADPAAPQDASAAPPIGMLRRDLSVPDFADNTLVTSSVILADEVEVLASQLPPDQQEANPYVFGPMRIVPSGTMRFSKDDELQVIFWIYGAAEANGGKPNVQIDYDFHQRLPDGEQYFNRTAPQELNAETLPPEFSVAAGHQLPGSLVVPLTSFPTGDFRLEIKVTDKVSGSVVTRNVNFTVLPV